MAELPQNPRWYAVRAELLAREQRYADAVRDVDAALAGPATDPERHHRERRRDVFRRLVEPVEREH